MYSRNIESGNLIPCENYCDQPYIVVLPSGAWLCVMTTGSGLESKPGQHIVSTTSSDYGVSWSELIDVESADDFMSSWATPLLVPGGRVYAFYNYNFDGKASQTGGWLVYRYTDDGGLTWSSRRHRVPMRITERDRTNDSSGEYQYFWVIDKPIVADGHMLFAFTKLRNGFQINGGEGWLICSDNILTERDPERINWELLPEGEKGIWHPDFGDIQEEFFVEELSDGSLYTLYRTEEGFIASATSGDGGRSWSQPVVLKDNTGRAIGNPRACPRLWKAPNGKYLLWHHNNSFPGWGNSPVRSPVWISGGHEAEGIIKWSQPEVLLYTQDLTLRGMSYPDFISVDDRYWVTETQKFEARVHEIDAALLEALWNQHETRTRTDKNLVLEAPGPESSGELLSGARIEIPQLPDLDAGSITIELQFRLNSLRPEQDLFNTFGPPRKGIRICTNESRSLRIEVTDGQSRRYTDVIDTPIPGSNARAVPHFMWDADANVLTESQLHHVVFILDGPARLLLVVVDGMLCDGGHERIQGWWRLNPDIKSICRDRICAVSDNLDGSIKSMRLYDRALTVTECIGNYRFLRSEI
ncbi:MAG: hypothetical protein HN368_08160 [Spirochaetales bacterium]|jgi:hypothetical protein|nr:hypothetical protein [Spirochaetales bacterium]